MACIDPTLKAHYQEQKDKWTALLIKAEAYMDFLMDTEGTKAFKFDSGEAMTWANYTEPGQFIEVIERITGWVDYYRNKLNGTGIVRMNLCRGR